MARKTVKVREGGPLAEKDHINPDPGFAVDPRRPVRLHADMGDTKKVKLGDPFQQLNVAATTYKDHPYTSIWFMSSRNPYTYNEQMQDAAKYAMQEARRGDKKMGGTGDSSYKSSEYIGIKQLEGWQVPEWHDRNLQNNGSKLNIGGVKVNRNEITEHINATWVNKMQDEIRMHYANR
jgi:hypothetical protein